MMDEEDQSSRPATGYSTMGSRPGTAGNPSRPVSETGSRPQTSINASRPASYTGSRPRSSHSAVGAASSSRVSSSRSTKSDEVVWSDEIEVKDANKVDEEEELIQEEEPPKGCWHWFTSFLGGMWATKDMNADTDDREVFVRTTIRELVIYCIFLAVLCILTFGMTSATMFYYTQVMSNLFDGSKKVTQVHHFWDFMETDMLDGLYWEYLYDDGNSKNFICPGGEETVGPCPVAPSDRNILYENRLLGLPRIRQLRVKNDSCDVHADFQNAIKQCYNSYSSSIEDEMPFGNGYRKKTGADAWRYRSESDLEMPSYAGSLAIYGGAGSIQDLSSLKNESSAIIKELKEGLWITRGTRFISLDFTVYNANINLFCIVKIAFEFGATGGVMTKANFRTVKLLRYVSASDHYIMACEFIFILFILYYIIEEILEMRRIKMQYFRSIWNFLDVIVITISCTCITFGFITHFVVQEKLKDLLADPDQFADFGSLASLSKSNNNAIAICVFFSWIKLFKYISFNRTMTQLSSTLSRCGKDVAGFGVMFSIVFLAFAQLGYLLFGPQVKDFSSFADAVFTLLRTILGDFNFHEIEQANRVLGPIFFLGYVFFVFFVLLNMFLAIINDTYSEVKVEIAAQRNEFEIGNYFKRGYNNILGSLGAREKAIDIENALKLSAQGDGVITYDEVRQNLKKANFSDLEIEMFFSRYDNDGDFKFDCNETKKIIDDLENDTYGDSDPSGRPLTGKEARELRSAELRQARAYMDESGMSRPVTAVGNVGGEEFGVLGRRVDRMEHSISSIVSKIDAVLIKLESMEKSKSKRQATMGKIIGAITESAGGDEESRRRQMEELVRLELQDWDDSRPSTKESGSRR